MYDVFSEPFSDLHTYIRDSLTDFSIHWFHYVGLLCSSFNYFHSFVLVHLF